MQKDTKDWRKYRREINDGKWYIQRGICTSHKRKLWVLACENIPTIVSVHGIYEEIISQRERKSKREEGGHYYKLLPQDFWWSYVHSDLFFSERCECTITKQHNGRNAYYSPKKFAFNNFNKHSQCAETLWASYIHSFQQPFCSDPGVWQESCK